MTPHCEDRTNGHWTNGAILRESEAWVHVPPSGVLVEDAARLLVHPPARQGTSRVWRCWPDRMGAEALILRTIKETRATGGTGLVWHTGDAVSPPFMDDLLPQLGFEKTEDLDVLAFELGADHRPKLPDLSVPEDLSAGLVTDRDGLILANVVEASVFSMSTRSEAETRAYLAGIADLETSGWQRPDEGNHSRVLRYLASVRNPEDEEREYAATAGAEVAGETVRLWGAATLPRYRRRGAYSALVMERCRHAHSLGATLALAKANAASSSPILRAAGFRRVATERRYALKMAARDARWG